MYAEIVVNAPLSRRRVPYLERTEGFAALAQTFTYSLPDRLADRLMPGQLVTVPFGARKLQGIVLALSPTSKVERLKDVYDIVDPVPVLSPAQIALARWMSDYYFAPLIDCVLQMFPPGLESEVQTTVALNPAARPPENPKEAQALILERLRVQGPLPISALVRGDRKKDIQKEIDKLVRSGTLLRATELLPPAAREKRERTVQLIAEPSTELRAKIRSKRQLALLDLMISRGGVGTILFSREITAATGVTSDVFQPLAEAGLIRIDQRVIWRDPLKGLTFEPSQPPALTSDQQRVWQSIQHALRSPVAPPAPILLFGVTGSGKTEMYLRAVNEVLAQGRQAVVLVPEIALTPQTIRRFAARLPSPPAVIHSRLSLGERYDQWRRIRAGEIGVVIGSRSALFAPLPRLGLVVIDEEHEASYKQEDHVHYHARDAALALARIVDVQVILGSATPSLESMWHAKQGDYTLLELKQRIANPAPALSGVAYQPGAAPRLTNPRLVVNETGALPGASVYQPRPNLPARSLAAAELAPQPAHIQLPPVEIVDMRAELKAGNTSILSRALRDALRETLAARQQAILFLNRRGTATFVMCRDCGYVMNCRSCDTPLTFHADQAELICHRCNRRYDQPLACPNCGSGRIRQFGTGTQKVEEVVRQMYPAARTLRWDRDATRAKGSHEAILQKFISHGADVLIGTQMVAKGHDLPLVTLVGVISADTTLHLPDFRAGERTFQTLAQVAGRAGRSRLLGRAIFQTYAPAHPAIVAAAQHDYETFYRSEIEFRRKLAYPPFTRLIRLLFAGSNAARVEAAADSLHHALQAAIRRRAWNGIELIGPAPCFIHKLRGNYRWQIIVKGDQPADLLREMVLPLGWRIDVDPISVL